MSYAITSHDLTSTADGGPIGTTRPITEASIRNANHIFNAVRGAMRQWDNSWNHNGMSLFLAEVPEGVLFYHGSGQEEPVKGMEWLAFEPEHALMFARGAPYIAPGKPGRPGEEPPPPTLETSHNIQKHYGLDEEIPDGGFWPRHHVDKQHPPPPLPPRSPFGGPHYGHAPPRPLFEPPHNEYAPHPPHHDGGPRGPFPRAFYPDVHNGQHILSEDERPRRPPPNIHFNTTGFLHFYRTVHPLRLLYVDGMSAGKTSKGTLDSQDYLLRYNADNNSTEPLPFQDALRAKALCNLTRDNWGSKIDGFIRMECGFEIVLCGFENHLHFERAQVIYRNDSDRNQGGDSGFWLYKALSDRFHNIGGERVQIDFANMVTAFTTDIDLFRRDFILPDEMLPRLKNQSEEALGILRKDVTNMILNPAEKSSVNWQSVADMLVQRYADPLQYLVTEGLSERDFRAELEAALRVFTSGSTDDDTLRTKRCVENFVPPSWTNTIAGRAVYEVAYGICSTLVHAISNITQTSSPDATFTTTRIRISELINWLDWPIWRECRPSCAVDEVCVLPIWPITGNVEDRKEPRCKNTTAYGEDGHGPGGGWRGGKNYWDDGFRAEHGG